MSIDSILVNNFRNIENAKLKFSLDINLIFGDNGSGKSSLIEALFMVGRGKSFRTNKIDNLINLDADSFLIFSKTNNEKNRIGIEKEKKDRLTIKVNEKYLYQLSKLTSLVALQIITPETYLLIESSPSIRRKYLDWIVFHVKHELIPYWKKYKTITMQRNSSLKQKLSKNEITIWDKDLIKITNIFTEQREIYTNLINSELEKYVPGIFGNEFKIQLDYIKGWQTNLSFKEVLDKNYLNDLKFGHTSQGLNKSDLKILVKFEKNVLSAKEYLSKGNKKLLSILLILIQIKIYKESGLIEDRSNMVLLIDDIFSELDEKNYTKIIEIIYTLNLQCFLTGVKSNNIENEINVVSLLERLGKNKKLKLFHVKHGRFLEKEVHDI